jgi:hypothetical protein
MDKPKEIAAYEARSRRMCGFIQTMMIGASDGTAVAIRV